MIVIKKEITVHLPAQTFILGTEVGKYCEVCFTTVGVSSSHLRMNYDGSIFSTTLTLDHVGKQNEIQISVQS